ncbi:hypothetical protein EPO04_03420 [Patescibacteria group bacterium]|nr:MAG: hypothetical protein EPO04_03420 [Patescibacteria group bacterium]
MLFNNFLLQRGLVGQEIITFLVSIQACSRISTPIALKSYSRSLTQNERQRYAGAHQALLQSNRLATTSNPDDVRPLLRELSNYLLSLENSPLCEADGCGSCSACEDWELRRQVFYKVLRAARDEDDLLPDDAPAFYLLTDSCEICREHYPGALTFEGLVEEIERRHNRHYDLPLLDGAVRWAVSMMFIDRLSNRTYRYHRTSGTRQGGLSSTDCTAGFLRGPRPVH